MANVQILEFTKFDFTKLQYFDPIKSVSNGKSKYISEQGYKMDDGKSSTVYIQTPKLTVLKNNIDERCIEVVLDPDTDVAFYNFIIRVDETNMISTYRNSRQWFGKQIPREDIDKAYITNLIQKKGKLPSIKLNLQVMRNNVITDIFNEKNDSINQDNINNGDSIIGILQFDGLRFLTDTISWDVSLSQAKVYAKPLPKSKLVGCVIDDSELKPTFTPKTVESPLDNIYNVSDLDLTINMDDEDVVEDVVEIQSDTPNEVSDDEYDFDLEPMQSLNDGNAKQKAVNEVNAFKQALIDHEAALNQKRSELMSYEDKMSQMRTEYLEYCHRYNLIPN